MVHALRKIHRSIVPGGVMLDIHPQPQLPDVSVVREGRTTPVGYIDWTQDNIEIRAARRRLASLERAGLFRTVRRTRFEFADWYDSVGEWLRIRKERGATSPVPGETIRAARAQLRRGKDKLLVTLKVHAATLDRL